MSPQPQTKSYRQPKNAAWEKLASSGKSTLNQVVIQCQMVSPENMHASNIRTEQAVCKDIYVRSYTYIYLAAINEKRSHGFGEQRLYGRAWREEREVECGINCSPPNKRNNFVNYQKYYKTLMNNFQL